MSDHIETTLSQSMTSVLRDIQESMSGEVAAIRSQTDQVESLLKDAIASLHESFASIHTSSDQQMTTMTALMMDVTGAGDDHNIFQKAEKASEILSYLIDTLLLSGKNNLRALTIMDTMQKRMQMMLAMEKTQGDLIEQLCACTESDDVDVAQVRQLSARIREEQEKQVAYTAATRARFKKTHHLIDTIASKDMDEVFAAKAKVEEILNHFFQINEIVSASRVEVNQVNAELRKHLGSAIRALQFEDISTQSLGHMDLHLSRMSGMMTILTDGLEGLDEPDIPADEYIGRISAIHAAMLAYHQTLQLEDSNPVSQDSMDEGDIDLF